METNDRGGMRVAPAESTPCGCGKRAVAASPEARRRVITLAAVSMAGALMPAAAWAQPQEAIAVGDRLVLDDPDGKPAPLRPADLKPGRPVLAFAFDAGRGVVRDQNRLLKLVLIRLTESEMSEATRARAAGGVLAYSAICTHQGCEVKTWIAKERVLACFCHASKFALLDGAGVVSGPAARPLPAVGLGLSGDQLVVSSLFTAAPGGAPA